MITLSIAEAIKTQIGGSASVNYDHVVFSPFTFNAMDRTITGRVRLTSTASPQAEVVLGEFAIHLGPGILTCKLDQRGVLRRVQLSGPQITAAQNILNDAQNALEQGFINLGVFVGVQSTGA